MPQQANSAFTQQLGAFRQEIDAIDSELFQLILKRADIVKQVGELKDAHDSSHIKLRPAREAKQLQSIFNKFQPSPFPAASALMIWRHLINGSLMIESPLRIATLAAPQALPDFAREYFGCYADMDYVNSPADLLQSLRESKADVGIFPMPHGADKTPWWLELAAPGEPLKIFLKFPYLPTACVRDGTAALAVSKVASEAMDGIGHSLLVLQTAAPISPMQLKETVYEAFANAHWHCTNKLENDSIACFLEIPEEIHANDARLQAIREKSSYTASIVGVVAKPLGEHHA